MLRTVNGQTVCADCGEVVRSAAEWSRHRAVHVIRYWAVNGVGRSKLSDNWVPPRRNE
jgi:hypothetical protein